MTIHRKSAGTKKLPDESTGLRAKAEHLSPVNQALFRAILRDRFPWLDTECVVSGADVVDALSVLYETLGGRQ